MTNKTDGEVSAAPTTLAFAPAAKYRITYQKADGTVKTYTISNPVDENSQVITCYAWKSSVVTPGLKTFNKARIRSFLKLCEIRA